MNCCRLVSLFFVLLITASAFASEKPLIGLEGGGNHFVIVQEQGTVRVRCDTEGDLPYITHDTYTCSSERLHPVSKARFILQGTLNETPDELTGQMIRADQRRLLIRSAMTSGGKSKKTYSLLENEWFQAALLTSGENRLEYTLSKKGKVLTTGVAVFEVTRRPEIQFCTHTQNVWSHNLHDCEQSVSFCPQHFRGCVTQPQATRGIRRARR